MAKLSAHGKTVGEIVYGTHVKRWMSDGTVLRNAGDGWKLKGKLKAGITPTEAFEGARARYDDLLRARPCLAAYLKELHSMARCLNKRGWLHHAVAVMYDDPDGVWSEACDGYGNNISADIDEVVHLCSLYRNAMIEHDEVNHTVTVKEAA